MDILLPVHAGAGVPADRLAAVQASGGVSVRHALHHHSNAAMAEECPRNASHAVLLWGGDRQRGGLFLLHLQVSTKHCYFQVSWISNVGVLNLTGLYECYYSVIDVKRYRKATSYCRGVQLLGYTVGSVLGQLLVSFDLLSYSNMLVLTLVLTAIALLTSLFLPMPQKSMFFHHGQASTGTKRDVDGTVDDPGHTSGANTSLEGGGGTQGGTESVVKESCGRVLLQLWRDFKQCYSCGQLLCWSVWWAMATCGYNQTINYVQVSPNRPAILTPPPSEAPNDCGDVSDRCCGNTCSLLRTSASTMVGWRRRPT